MENELTVLENNRLPIKSRVAVAALFDIYKRKNVLTPEIVVDEARDKESPLHPVFEWDNKKAANEYRLVQARHLIRIAKVETVINGKPVHTRAFISIRKDEKGELSTSPFAKGESVYVSVDTVLQDEKLYDYTIRKALLEMQSFVSKYKDLKILSPILHSIQKGIDSLRKESSEIIALPEPVLNEDESIQTNVYKYICALNKDFDYSKQEVREKFPLCSETNFSAVIKRLEEEEILTDDSNNTLIVFNPEYNPDDYFVVDEEKEAEYRKKQKKLDAKDRPLSEYLKD